MQKNNRLSRQRLFIAIGLFFCAGAAFGAAYLFFFGYETLSNYKNSKPNQIKNSVQAKDRPAMLQETELINKVYFDKTLCLLPIKKYRIWVEQYDPTKKYGAFGFSTILPNLDPVTSDSLEALSWGKGNGRGKELSILVEFGLSYLSQEQLIATYFRDSEAMKKLQDSDEQSGKKIVRFSYLNRNNYQLLSNGCKKYHGYARGADVIQICTQDNRMIAASCSIRSAPDMKTFPFCRSTINISEKVGVSYSYGYNYFDNALSIHESVENLLKSFCKF